MTADAKLAALWALAHAPFVLALLALIVAGTLAAAWTERAVDRAAEAWTGTPEVLRGERDA